MPLITDVTYCINFLILESDDPTTIVIQDISSYIGVPEQPLIDVVLPGFTGYVSNSYNPGGLKVLDALSLDLICEDTCSGQVLLPDGVYQITMKVCPYEELFKSKCFLKTSIFNRDMSSFLLKIDRALQCYDVDKLTNELLEIDLLIESAKAEAKICNVEVATHKYQHAVKKLSKLIDKVNCK